MAPPAVSGFPLMSSCLVEDVLYVGSRNLRPARVAAIDLTTRRTVAVHDLPTGNFVQALRSGGGPARADSTLYVGVTHAPSGPNVHRIDRGTGEVVPWASVLDMYVRDLCPLPDGRVAVVGRQPRRGRGPGAWLAGPDSVTELCVPDPAATQGLCVDAVAGRLWVGTGANLGGDGSGGAGLFAIDPDGTVHAHATRVLAGSRAVRCVDSDGTVVVAGTEAATAVVVEVDLGTGAERAWPLDAKVVSRVDRHLVTAAEPCQLWQLDRFTGEARLLGVPLPDGEVWGLHVRAGTADRPTGPEVVGTASGGWLFEVDVGSCAADHPQDRTRRTRVTELGVPPGAQLGMSIAAVPKRYAAGPAVVTAGNFTLQRHDLTTGEVTELALPGEAKDMARLGDTLHLGVYNSQGLWSLNLTDPEARPRRTVALPVHLNRPQVVAADDARNRVWVGIQCDWDGTGALVGHRPAPRGEPPTPDATMIVDDPLGGQLVRAVHPGPDGIRIGGERQSDRRAPGRLGLVDADSGEVTSVVTAPFRCGISAIEDWPDGRLVVADTDGGLSLFDPTDRTWQVLHAGDGSTTVRPRMQRHAGRLWMVTAAELIMVEEPSGTLRPWCRLDGEWYSGPRVCFADGCAHTLAGRELINIRLD